MERVTLEIPDEVYRAAQQVAEAIHQPINVVLQASLAKAIPPLDDLPPEEAAALANLVNQDDAALWRVARVELSADEQQEFHMLLDIQNARELTSSQNERLDALADTYGRLLVQRAHAYLLLARRGYRVPVQ